MEKTVFIITFAGIVKGINLCDLAEHANDDGALPEYFDSPVDAAASCADDDGWFSVDEFLHDAIERDPDYGPQEFANENNLVLIRDDDAVNTGPCWWAIRGVDVKTAERMYEDNDGTVSSTWAPDLPCLPKR